MSCGWGRRAFARKGHPPPHPTPPAPQGRDLSFPKTQCRLRPAAPRGLGATNSNFLCSSWGQRRGAFPKVTLVGCWLSPCPCPLLLATSPLSPICFPHTTMAVISLTAQVLGSTCICLVSPFNPCKEGGTLNTEFRWGTWRHRAVKRSSQVPLAGGTITQKVKTGPLGAPPLLLSPLPLRRTS